MQLEYGGGVSPSPRKPHSSPALASGQTCLPNPFSSCHEIPSQEVVELGDQLSGVILMHFLVSTVLPAKPSSLSP